MANNIDSTAQIASGVQLGSNTTVGAYAIIHEGVTLGDNCTIGSHCELGLPSGGASEKVLKIGNDANIRSHAVIYTGSQFGDMFSTGHFVQIRENTQGGNWLGIGSYSDIQGDCSLDDCVQIHSSVQIAKGTKIGALAYIFPHVHFMNDSFPPSDIEEPVFIGKMSVVATGVSLLPGVSVGSGCFIASNSVIRQNIADLDCVAGDPARSFSRLDRFYSLKRKEYFHPWVNRYPGKFSEAAQPVIQKVIQEIDQLISANKQ